MWLRIIMFYLALKPCRAYNLQKSTTKSWFHRWQWPPEKIGRWHFWVEQLTTRHLNNMTAELARDVDVKYRMMKSVADNSKKQGANAKFAVGQIVAEIKTRFKHMVQIYATFAKYNDMAINNEYTDLYNWVERPNRDVKNYIYAFMMLESDYNEIMNFNEMFFDALALKNKEAKIQLQSDLLELNRTLELSKISHEKTSIATTPTTTENTVTKGTTTTDTPTEIAPTQTTQSEEKTTAELPDLRNRGTLRKRGKYLRKRQRRPRPNNREAMKKFAK